VPTKKQLVELKKDIAAHVAEGFSSRTDIVGRFTEDLDEEAYGEHDEASVKGYVEEAIRAHHAKQAMWTKPTDCDKLDAAFRSLNRKGVLARQNFSCCSNCGEAEIGGEMNEAKANGRKVIGYAFYHMQDTESAVMGHGIYIKYGAAKVDAALTKVIGQKIFDALTAAGLKPNWNGKPDTCVVVALKWKKRRKDRLPKAKTTTAARRAK
jgi:hypothetical protein